MVRRAEYALGKAIRAGQEQGEIRRRGETATHYDRWSGETGHTLNSTKASPTDFASSDELHNRTGTGIYDLVDDVSEQQFEEAISEAATTSLARTWSARSRASSRQARPGRTVEQDRGHGRRRAHVGSWTRILSSVGLSP